MVESKNFFKRDVLSSEDFSRDEVDFVLAVAEDIECNSKKYSESLKNKVMAPLFFEPSTRTTTSFQSAMLQLGGRVLDFDVDRSSLSKGETLSDTAKMIDGYSPDVVVMRHPKDGSAKLVSDILSCPLMNAGDGKNQHPTQTFLDLYSIKKTCGKIDEVKIAIVGDLKYGRTVHSLSLALSKYQNCRIFFVSPDLLKMPRYILEKLSKTNLSFSEFNLDKLSEIISQSDIIYMTRIQRERFPEGPEGEQQYHKISEHYHLKLEMLETNNKKIKVMHPLPKVNEIESEIDETDYAYYFQQAKNGLFVRKALLYLALGEKNG